MTTLIIGLLIPLLGTMLGSAFVFFMKKDMSPRLQKSLLGFASGVMVAASVWMIMAVIGVAYYLTKDRTTGTYIILFAMCFKIAESSLRMIK